MRRPSGNGLLIATSMDGGKLMLTKEQRSRHLYVTGSTGSGKSKFLEHLIRQDIINWRESECGLLLLDPHGAIYDGLMQWLTRNSDIYKRPVIPIDLRRDDWIVAYNVLREREQVAASVVTDNLVDAVSYVWGAAGTDQTPLFARIATAVFQALYEHKLTLAEALKILEFSGREFRATLARGTQDEATRGTLEELNGLKALEYQIQVGSTRNRFQRLLRNISLRAAFGQTEVSFDFGQALREGSIVLVSLATEGGTVSQENASTFATLMLADLWTAAKERGKGTDPKPFYLYLDEFQRFVSPTIAENLDEARGFGLHLTLAHQYPSQLIEASREYGQRLYESVMENARSKVVFSLSLRDRNLAPLADWLYSGTFDPSRVKHEIHSTKVMGYSEETREISSRGTARGIARNEAKGEAVGTSSVQGDTWGAAGDGSVILPPTQWSHSTAEARASTDTSSRGQSESESESESLSEVPVFIPIFGQELSSLQFSPLDEQRFQAEQRIMMQKERHATARFLDMTAPVELRTPDVSPLFVREGRVEEYRLEQLAKLPYVLSCEEAQARLEKRHSALALPAIAPETEPRSYRRRVGSRATIKKHAGERETTRAEVELQERDLAILQGLFESRLMTLSHITRLFFDGHGEAAKKRIQRLKEERYIRERTRRVYQPSILHLSRRSFGALSERGMLLDYPQLAWNQLEDRANVSDLTLKHEIQVVDVKTSFSRAIIRSTPHHELIEFLTWPLLYQFWAAQPVPPGSYQGTRVLVKPDGFVRIHERTPEDLFEHFLFLEVDRSTESRETLARRAFGYQDFYRQGGLALRYGAAPEAYRDYPFRVLMVFLTEERRNNMAERLLQNDPPALTMVWLTTFSEVITDPLGAIWMRPVDYREITKGTLYDSSRPRTGAYRRDPAREGLVAHELDKRTCQDV